MVRFFALFSFFFFSPWLYANASYQIELIIFQYTTPEASQIETSTMSERSNLASHTTPLQAEYTATPHFYQTLPFQKAQLYGTLRRLLKYPEYQVLATYTWRQPRTAHTRVQLPQSHTYSTTLEGVIQVRAYQYYDVDLTLYFQSLSPEKRTFTLSQNFRLKPNIIYYMDHPQGGALIQIHA